MNKGKFLVIGAVLLLLTAINVEAQSATTYSGRAAGVIILSPNPASAGDTGALPSGGGTQTMTTPLVVLPGVTTGPIISSTSGSGNASQSSTTVSTARVTAGGYIITVASATSYSQCICCPNSVDGACTARSNVTGVIVTDPSGNNVPINVTGNPNQVVTLNGAGTITFNERIMGDGEITVNAVHVNITNGGTTTNVIIGSAYSDIVCGTISPTPANVTVSGRVVTSSGVGIAGATVTLTASTGVRQSATSNATGNFSIQSVTVGQSYIVQAAAKSFVFQSQIISVFDEITDLEIRANP